MNSPIVEFNKIFNKFPSIHVHTQQTSQKMKNIRYTPLQVFPTFQCKQWPFKEYLFAEIFAYVTDICLGKVFRREIAGPKVIYMFKAF